MPVDPYTICPCGSGKKLKFCCSDLVGEIEKIHRMIEGDQPRAALRHVEQTLASHPGRASLLDLKATLELALGDLNAARRTVDQFVADHADSPTAQACHALLLAEAAENPQAAVAALQRALGLVDREMPQRVFEAIGAVGQMLLVTGHVVAAQAHLWLNAAIAPQEETRARELLIGLNHYSGLPLMLRDQLHFRRWPEQAPWKAEAEEASQLTSHGKWQKAVEIVDRLGQKYGADPVLVYNRALLGGWLADERALVAGLHAYAQMDVPLDDAIEAEAIAQLLDEDQREPKVDSVIQIYENIDLEALVAKLSADRRVQSFEMSPEMLAGSEGPRPRHAFLLLDRPMPATGVDLRREEVPRLAGILAIYGRQTDASERLELSTDKGPTFEATINSLQEIAGESLGHLAEEKMVGAVSPTEQALNWRWHFPRDTPPETRRRLLAEERRAAIVERWPSVPRPALGGKSPREVAGNAELRIPLMAAILVLEQGSNSDRDREAVAELRTALGLPQPEPIDPAIVDVSELPLVRVPRLKTESVSDDDLVQLYRHALLTGAQAATKYLAREAVRRPSLAGRIPPHDAYRRMVAAETDPDRALELLDEARRASEAAGQSTATWDVAELELYITSGNAAMAKTTLERIEKMHLHDPEVASAVYRLLYETGVIPQEGMPIDEAVEESLPAAVGAVPEPPAGGIWTPESVRPAGGKSKLWTPS